MICPPIAYIVFNRPRHTQNTFAAIRAQQPSKLFIIADGPRPSHPTDTEHCQAVRDIVAQIDWPCEVHRNFAEQNMGCKKRVSSGLDWVFEHVESAIIIEDDCLPHPDFFGYCAELLDRYKADERVWVITGNNFQNGVRRGDASYYFSKFNHCWGWATWRRAWVHYQVDVPFWAEWKLSTDWLSKTPDLVERKVFGDLFDRVSRGEIDTWDYQWTACVWYHNGLTATPNTNLVTNIGFGPDATHTLADNDRDGLPSNPLGPLTHPTVFQANRRADKLIFDQNFGGASHPDRMINKIKGKYQRMLRLPKWVLKQLMRLIAPKP
jgi:hypothetical protein